MPWFPGMVMPIQTATNCTSQQRRLLFGHRLLGGRSEDNEKSFAEILDIEMKKLEEQSDPFIPTVTKR